MSLFSLERQARFLQRGSEEAVKRELRKIHGLIIAAKRPTAVDLQSIQWLPLITIDAS
jgi:hypothetical protein